MIRFESDYLEGAHPAILKMLSDTNFEQTPGYGEDRHCAKARKLICSECKDDELPVHFIGGGTLANATIIASILRSHQGVIAADTGHISVHETGSVEATGHKVLTLPNIDGKITSQQVDEYVVDHYADASFEHTVQPGMVYISNPTEVGTIYSKAELTALFETCRKHRLPLFMDGARLGYGLVCAENDLELSDIAQLCDVFYIGGTKIGALFGEAVVIPNPQINRDFRYHIKQHGGMMAKGRILGIQFEALFTDGLYWDISRHAVSLALDIKNAFIAKGFEFTYNSPTNQQFVILPEVACQALGKKYSSSLIERRTGGACVTRFCTSWATNPESVAQLIEDIAQL